MKHRPVGLGVSGLADVFIRMNLPFNCAEAKQVNKHIFETIYHASLKTSCALAQAFGPYETFANSPASQGILQFDMWDVDPGQERYDWKSLKENIMTHGLRNSLLLAPMPTASTAQILGNKVEMDIANTLAQNTTLLRLGVHFNTLGPRAKVQDTLKKNWDRCKSFLIMNLN